MGGWLAVGLGLVGARAADDGAPCVPMSESAFADLVDAARASIDAQDLDAFERWSSELERRVPCLTFVPTPADWAGWLVAVAAVDHFRGREWRAPLATALQVAPGIDRLVGPGHEIAAWSPPPPPPPSGPVPRRVELYVDGRRAEALPAAVGVHLVQVRTDVGFASRLLRDEPVPPAWIAPPTPGAPAMVVVSAVGGAGRRGQQVDAPGPFAGDWQQTTPDVGVQLRARIGTPLAVLADVTATPARPLDALVAAGLHARFGAVGIGASAATVARREGDEVRRAVLPGAALTAAGWSSGPTTVDGGVVFGVGPALRHAALRGGVTIPGEGIRLRLGLEGRLAAAGYEQPGSERTLSATDLRLLAQAGVVWGTW